MELIRGLANLKAAARGCVLTIGNFDGVHLGHQALIAATVERARRLGLPATVLTFEPTPREYFARHTTCARISTLRAKFLDLQQLGVDRWIVQRFHAGFAAQEPVAFVREELISRLGIRALIVGDDFRFGAKRAGDLALLEQEGRVAGFEVVGIGSVLSGDLRCSSTLIREALAAPDLAHAERLLGRPYRMVGRVKSGLRLGRTLNMPTANVYMHRRPALRYGIYVVELTVLGSGVTMPGVANLGVRPTLGLTRCLLETHVLNGSPDLYGATVEVRFRQYLRPEERFDSLDALSAQMQIDKADALAFFGVQPA